MLDRLRERLFTLRALWILGCLIAFVAVLSASESCRNSIARGEDCSSFSQFSYDNRWVPLAIVLLGLFGPMLISRVRSNG